MQNKYEYRSLTKEYFVNMKQEHLENKLFIMNYLILNYLCMCKLFGDLINNKGYSFFSITIFLQESMSE